MRVLQYKTVAEFLGRVKPWLTRAEAENGQDHEEFVRCSIADRQLYVWEDGRPVSIAAWAGPTDHGARLALVYTPPEWRRKGYATSCVAALTRLLLQRGAEFCFLYADAAKATPNGVYRRIGYRPGCDWQQWHFD